MFEDAISLLSIFTSMNTWLTPTVLFLLLNLMIGTIAFTSGFTSHKPNYYNHQSQPIFHHHNHRNNHRQPPLQQPSLTRSPSLLQRLKSAINFSSFYSQQPQQQPPISYFQPPIQQSQPDPLPEIKPDISNYDDDDEDQGPTLDEVYNRIKQGFINPQYGRQNSDTKPSNGEIPVKLAQKMKKSASDMSAFNHFEFHESTDNVAENVAPTIMEDDDMEERENSVMKMEERDDEGVDAKADDFINKFKKQLQMQRNDSMLKEYKQIIHSRTSDISQ